MRCGHRPAPQRGRCRQSCAPRAAAASSAKFRATVLSEPWDSAPRPWRLFWAVKLSAAVVESDAAAQSVRVLPVESLGLALPASLDEARQRAATNVVVFRQNYLLLGLAVALAGALRHAALLCGGALLLLSAVCTSDRLLGEVALATDGKVVWNAKRVGGLDRAVLVRAPLVAAAGTFTRGDVLHAVPDAWESRFFLHALSDAHRVWQPVLRSRRCPARAGCCGAQLSSV